MAFVFLGIKANTPKMSLLSGFWMSSIITAILFFYSFSIRPFTRYTDYFDAKSVFNSIWGIFILVRLYGSYEFARQLILVKTGKL